MAWISDNKQTWRITILVLMLLATLGPWTFDRIYVPVGEPCQNSLRLEGNFCGIPLAGIRMLPWLLSSTLFSSFRFVIGELSLLQAGREVLFGFLFILLLLPTFSMLLLSVTGGKRSWRWFHIVVLCLAIALGLLFITSSIAQPNLALWGLWFYIILLFFALVLELLCLWYERPLYWEQDNYR